MKLFRSFAVCLVSIIGLNGCASIGSKIIQPYRFEIQQGNFVSQEMVAQLRPGMSRDQVRFVLGSPVLASIFHQNRWDYPFYVRRSNGQIIERKFTVFFDQDTLARWDGDALPSERPADPAPQTAQPTPKPAAAS